MVRALVRALRREGWRPAVTADEPAYGTAPAEQAPRTGAHR
jgi:hypothetical protein